MALHPESENSGIAVDLEAQLYIAPQATNIGAFSFPEGYNVFAEIEFLLIDDRLEMEFLPNKGLAVLDQLNEIVVGSEDFIVIKAASDQQPKSLTALQKKRGMQQKNGPELLFCTFSEPDNPDPNFRAPALKISGEIDFLGLTDSVFVEYKDGKFQMDLDTSTPLGTSFDISARFNSVTDMEARGNATLGLKHPFGISGRGSFLLDDNVHASLGFSVSGETITASASFGITILGESLNAPSISLNIDGKALENIADYAIDALENALDEFFGDALKWLKAFKNGLIEGFKDLEGAAKVLANYFKTSAKAAASLIRAVGYAADEVVKAIEKAFDILEKEAKDIVDFVYNSAAGCAQVTGLSSL